MPEQLHKLPSFTEEEFKPLDTRCARYVGQGGTLWLPQ